MTRFQVSLIVFLSPLASFCWSFKAGKGGELTHDEATIISGALDLTEKVDTDLKEKQSDRLIALSLASVCNKELKSCHFFKDPASEYMHVMKFASEVPRKVKIYGANVTVYAQ